MRLKFLVGLLLIAGSAQPAVHGSPLEYKQGDTTLEGYVAYDDAVQGRRPAVLVVHDWMGPGDFTRHKAEALAGMGYVALAADIYGQGVRPKNADEAARQATYYKEGDRALLRARAKAGLDELLRQPQTDPHRVAAIGFCFGGTTVLELARSGAPLVGVVSFHGALDTPHPEEARRIRGKVLVLHGADDPFEPPEQLAAFEKEMRDAGVDWQMVKYGGAVHAFTIPSAGNDSSKGAAYNARADRRSWQAMKDFFAEIFKIAIARR